MSVKTGDARPIVRSSGKPLPDRRAVVGSSGRPEEGMVLRSGTATVAKVLGQYSSSDSADSAVRTGEMNKGMRFNVGAMTDQSIGAPGDGSKTAFPQGEK